MVDSTHDAFTVRRVFGEPIEHGDVVLIPAAAGAAGAAAPARAAPSTVAADSA